MTEAPAGNLDVFFYGLFMDEALLREKGLHPLNRRIASVENFCLLIGARATLVRCQEGSVHGVLFSLTQSEIDELYSDSSVSIYRPETVSARLADGSIIPAVCFNLPAASPIAERNPEYAAKLRDLAQRIGLPPDYVASIQ